MNARLIDEIIQNNTMDYSAYVLLDRAIPDIRDGLKPVHRRILYAMHKMKATKFTKSGNVEGEVFKYHPHAGSYPTMVNMTQKDKQITPFLIGKGNFSYHTSRDLQFGSSRYTEIKLSELSQDILSNLNQNSVDFISNYDGTLTIPEVLPVHFPSILTYCNSGIGVGMKSSIPSFNLKELCDAMIRYINQDEKTLLIPDFATGGFIINDNTSLKKINDEGKGSIKLRGKAIINKNVISITEIPYTTTIEAIIDKIVELNKKGELKEITDVQNLTDLKGIEIEVVCKKNTNMEIILQKLYSMTSLEDTLSVNMNVICDKLPKVMGVWDIIDKWLSWRTNCIIKATNYEIDELNRKLHLSNGLLKIIDFIDILIPIIREAKNDNLMIKEIMTKFDLDVTQAEYISNIKLKNINKEYLQKQICEIDKFKDEIKSKEKFVKDYQLILESIAGELNEISKKYQKPRMTQIIDNEDIEVLDKEELIEDYNTILLLTKEQYFKKVKLIAYKGQNKLKDTDEVICELPSTNKADILLFADSGICYKLRSYELEDNQLKDLGVYLPNNIIQKGENVLGMATTNDYDGHIIIVYENGKIAKITMKSYYTKTKVKRLLNSLSDKNGKALLITQINEDVDIEMTSNFDKTVVVNTRDINEKGKRDTLGVQAFKCSRKGFKVDNIVIKTT